MKNNGMTLIELVVAIGVIGILSTIAAPTITSLIIDKRVSGAALMMHIYLTKARMQAVSQNVPVIVALTSNHSFSLISDSNANSVIDAGEAGTPVDLQSEYGAVACAAASGYEPVFYPNGTARPGLLTVSSQQAAKVKTILISSAGRIWMQ